MAAKSVNGNCVMNYERWKQTAARKEKKRIPPPDVFNQIVSRIWFPSVDFFPLLKWTERLRTLSSAQIDQLIHRLMCTCVHTFEFFTTTSASNRKLIIPFVPSRRRLSPIKLEFSSQLFPFSEFPIFRRWHWMERQLRKRYRIRKRTTVEVFVGRKVSGWPRWLIN